MSKDPQPPSSCPVCGDDHIHCDQDQYDSGRHYNYMRCRACGAGWTEIYEFVEFQLDETL